MSVAHFARVVRRFARRLRSELAQQAVVEPEPEKKSYSGVLILFVMMALMAAQGYFLATGQMVEFIKKLMTM